MRITARIVADSVSAVTGIRLTTMELEYPRFIHAEFMTHRVFSRNASSSRAIPVKKLLGKALEDPAFFVHIGKNQPGMQANEEVDATTKSMFMEEWEELARIAAKFATRWADEYGIHKQVVNRVMEPWHHIKVLVTATEWDNFFELRNHPDAQPEIRVLAIEMANAMASSVPQVLQINEWHLPYVAAGDRLEHSLEKCIQFSVARSARTSYFNHDGTNPNVENDLKLYTQLVGAVPLHASPSEHQATPNANAEFVKNFRGWTQHRVFLERDLSWDRHPAGSTTSGS